MKPFAQDAAHSVQLHRLIQTRWFCFVEITELFGEGYVLSVPPCEVHTRSTPRHEHSTFLDRGEWKKSKYIGVFGKVFESALPLSRR